MTEQEKLILSFFDRTIPRDRCPAEAARGGGDGKPGGAGGGEAGSGEATPAGAVATRWRRGGDGGDEVVTR